MLSEFVGDLDEELIAYRGSLTTPPCAPASWIVATRVRKISVRDVREKRRSVVVLDVNFPLPLALADAQFPTDAGSGRGPDRAQLSTSAEEAQATLFGVLS